MGCGCKNKPTVQTPTTNQPTQTSQTTQNNQNSIQEAVKKVVEKYYKKK